MSKKVLKCPLSGIDCDVCAYKGHNDEKGHYTIYDCFLDDLINVLEDLIPEKEKNT
jgi:hypothetical protein